MGGHRRARGADRLRAPAGRQPPRRSAAACFAGIAGSPSQISGAPGRPLKSVERAAGCRFRVGWKSEGEACALLWHPRAVGGVIRSRSREDSGGGGPQRREAKLEEVGLVFGRGSRARRWDRHAGERAAGRPRDGGRWRGEGVGRARRRRVSRRSGRPAGSFPVRALALDETNGRRAAGCTFPCQEASPVMNAWVAA